MTDNTDKTENEKVCRKCGYCNGTGQTYSECWNDNKDTWKEYEQCENCHGTGKILVCPKCSGRKRIKDKTGKHNLCLFCDGTGQVEDEGEFKVCIGCSKKTTGEYSTYSQTEKERIIIPMCSDCFSIISPEQITSKPGLIEVVIPAGEYCNGETEEGYNYFCQFANNAYDKCLLYDTDALSCDGDWQIKKCQKCLDRTPARIRHENEGGE